MICACGKTLGAANKSGKCKPCHARWLSTDPEMNARRIAALNAHYDMPGVRESRRQGLLRAMENLSPAERRRRSEHGKWQAANVLHRPDVRARTLSPEAIAKRAAAHTETSLGWCPPHLRDHYRYLLHMKHVKAVDARRMIEEMVPGTLPHAERSIANVRDAQRIRAERDKASAY